MPKLTKRANRPDERTDPEYRNIQLVLGVVMCGTLEGGGIYFFF